jgi:hypothetical protein
MKLNDLQKVEALELVVGLAEERVREVRAESLEKYMTDEGRDYVLDKMETACQNVRTIILEVEPDFPEADESVYLY